MYSLIRITLLGSAHSNTETSLVVVYLARAYFFQKQVMLLITVIIRKYRRGIWWYIPEYISCVSFIFVTARSFESGSECRILKSFPVSVPFWEQDGYPGEISTDIKLWQRIEDAFKHLKYFLTHCK